jgi:hypothetical protein
MRDQGLDISQAEESGQDIAGAAGCRIEIGVAADDAYPVSKGQVNESAVRLAQVDGFQGGKNERVMGDDKVCVHRPCFVEQRRSRVKADQDGGYRGCGAAEHEANVVPGFSKVGRGNGVNDVKDILNSRAHLYCAKEKEVHPQGSTSFSDFSP